MNLRRYKSVLMLVRKLLVTVMSLNLVNILILNFILSGRIYAQQIPIDRCSGTIVNCLVAPCDTAKCDQYPDAICANDYCDGCNARFFDASDKEFQNELECS